MATIGSLAVNIIANTDKVVKGLRAAQNSLAGVAGKLSALGAAATASLTGMVYTFENLGSSLHDMSSRTGVTVERLSALKYAAEQSSTSIDALMMAFRVMQKSGIDPNRFGEIAARIAAIPDPTMRAQEALKIFGKRGVELLPMIRELPQLTAEFEKLGGTVTTEMAKKADALGDSWGKLRVAMQSIANHIAAVLAPVITNMSEWIAANGRQIVDWIDKHQTLIKWLGATAAVLAIVTPILWSLNTVLATISATMKVLNAVAAGGILSKLITLAMAHPAAAAVIIGGAALAAGGYAAYNYATTSSSPAPSSTPANNGPSAGAVATNTAAQVRQQQRTNSLLELQMRQPTVVIKQAGVR